MSAIDARERASPIPFLILVEFKEAVSSLTKWRFPPKILLILFLKYKDYTLNCSKKITTLSFTSRTFFIFEGII